MSFDRANYKRPEKLIWQEEPPWHWDQIWASVFASSEKTDETINSLPGAMIHNDLETLCFVLDMFLESVKGLFASINKFKSESGKSNFWYRTNDTFRKKLNLKVSLGVFSSTLSAMSLVDNSRNFSKVHSVDGYKEKISELFIENAQHSFIQSLRNYFAHVTITEANWLISWNREEEGRKVIFQLKRDELLKWNNWKSLAREYINSNEKDINVESLFSGYSQTVQEFYEWLKAQVSVEYGQEISKYQKYSNIRKGVAVYCHWNAMIQQVFLPKKLNPYNFLDRYLTEEELEKVKALPHRTKEQVDKIVNIIDEYQVCDEMLKNHIYQLFQIE